jgi:hypothetical protein
MKLKIDDIEIEGTPEECSKFIKEYVAEITSKSPHAPFTCQVQFIPTTQPKYPDFNPTTIYTSSGWEHLRVQ